jgi:hypothetical protein
MVKHSYKDAFWRDAHTAGTGPGGCYPAYYGAAVAGTPAPNSNLQWPRCLSADTALAFFGQRCGNAMDKFMCATVEVM